MAKKGLQKAAEDLASIRKILTNVIWIAVIIVVLAGLGWYLAQSRHTGNDVRTSDLSEKVTKPVILPIPWDEVD
jgi:hypothetical protein